jgi:hypothetical protein
MIDFSSHCPTSRTRRGVPYQRLMIGSATLISRCSSRNEGPLISSQGPMLQLDIPSTTLNCRLDCQVVLHSGPRLFAPILVQNVRQSALNSVFQRWSKNAAINRNSWLDVSMSITLTFKLMNSRYVGFYSQYIWSRSGNVAQS